MIEIMSDDIVAVVAAHAEKRRALVKGAYLFHRGDRVRSVFVVVSGGIDLTRFQEGGAPLVLQRAGPGSFLAEASVYSPVYHCDALAAERSVVCEMNRPAFLALLAEAPGVANLWAGHLAREVQAARYRAEILTRRGVADRLDGWLAWQGGVLPLKGAWKTIADQIGVSPEALYRELAKRRKA